MTDATTPENTATPKRRGRPPLGPGEGKAISILLRTTPELAQRAQQMADAAGMSRNAWIERLIRLAEA